MKYNKFHVAIICSIIIFVLRKLKGTIIRINNQYFTMELTISANVNKTTQIELARSAIDRYNRDYAKMLLSGDIRYMQTSMTENGMVKSKSAFDNAIYRMKHDGWKSGRSLESIFASNVIHSDKTTSIFVDEIWEYTNMREENILTSARCKFFLVLSGGEYKVEYQEILSTIPNIE